MVAAADGQAGMLLFELRHPLNGETLSVSGAFSIWLSLGATLLVGAGILDVVALKVRNPPLTFVVGREADLEWEPEAEIETD